LKSHSLLQMIRRPIYQKTSTDNNKPCMGYQPDKSNFILSAKIALPLKKRPFVSPRQTLYESAFGTPCWRRNFYFFVKRKIVGLNGELLLTILTITSFLLHNYFFNNLLLKSTPYFICAIPIIFGMALFLTF